MNIDKKLLVDTMGRPLTQSLFLECGYNVQYAVFTFNDEDKTYNGKIYPSLKKLFLECEDPTEYKFARKYLLGWNHWKRLNENKMLKDEFEQWREELEIAIRADAVMSIRDMTAEGTNFQAAKWLADRGWDKRGAGRPSKSELDREKRIQSRIGDELMDDINRMNNVVELRK